MSEIKKDSVETLNEIPEKLTTSFILDATTKEITTPKANKPKSELQLARQSFVQKGDEKVRNVSEYFKAFRILSFDKPDLDAKGIQKMDKDKNLLWLDSELTVLLKAAQAKGRRFDSNKVDAIVNGAKLKLILDADDFLQTKRTNPIKQWSTSRILTAFYFATEIKKTAAAK